MKRSKKFTASELLSKFKLPTQAFYPQIHLFRTTVKKKNIKENIKSTAILFGWTNDMLKAFSSDSFSFYSLRFLSFTLL
jgi:hypothetical protein